MKNINLFLYILITLTLIVLSGCGSSKPDFTALVSANPDWLIAKSDSLIKSSPEDEELTRALNQVYFNRGENYLQALDWPAAIAAYDQAMKYIPRQKEARYGKAMAEGQQYFNKGGPNDLWEALVKFGEAAAIDTSKAEPLLWLGRSYEKKDENDFELILEAYDEALAKGLPPELEKAALDERANVKRRQEIFEAFWK